MATQALGEMASSAVAGIVAAIVATAILGAAKWIHMKHLQRLDIKQIRQVLTTGRKRVMASADEVNPSMGTSLPADGLRCAQYNLMIKQLAIALDHTTTRLPYSKRKHILEALDWYHADSLHAIKNADGPPVFVTLPEGKWPTVEMKASHAIEKFDRLEAIGWLKVTSRK